MALRSLRFRKRSDFLPLRYNLCDQLQEQPSRFDPLVKCRAVGQSATSLVVKHLVLDRRVVRQTGLYELANLIGKEDVGAVDRQGGGCRIDPVLEQPDLLDERQHSPVSGVPHVVDGNQRRRKGLCLGRVRKILVNLLTAIGNRNHDGDAITEEPIALLGSSECLVDLAQREETVLAVSNRY